MLTAEQTLDIHRLIALHGHVADIGDPDLFGQVYTDDIVYDLEDVGSGTLHGRDALWEAAERMGDRAPVGHHVTNIVVTEGDDGAVRVRSKAIAILRDGRATSVVYQDLLRRTPKGWRIAHRAVRAGTAPMTPRC